MREAKKGGQEKRQERKWIKMEEMTERKQIRTAKKRNKERGREKSMKEMTEKESETEKKKQNKMGENRYRGNEKDGGRREVKIEERE